MPAFFPVDYTKSIAKQKLVYKSSVNLTFEHIVYYIGFITILSCPVAIVTMSLLWGKQDISIGIIVSLLVVIVWLVSNVVLLNAFVIIEGKQRDINKKDIITVLSKYKTLENLDQTKPNSIRDVKSTELFVNGRVVTCLFKGNKMYLNITSLLRGNSFSFFSGFYNYISCKLIEKDFKKLQTINQDVLITHSPSPQQKKYNK